MSATITRRAMFFLAALSLCLAFQPAGQTAAADESARLTVTIDENAETAFGAAELILDGEKQGLLSAGCCMFITVTPGSHVLTLRWADTAVSKEFEAEAGGEVAFLVSAERQVTLVQP